MNRILILHGWEGSDYPHWQSHLAMEIAKNYGCVCFPKIEDMYNPIKSEWMKKTKEILDSFNPNIVVCHSLANTLWFWLCNEDIKRVKKLFLVAPPSLNTKEEALKSFFPCKLPSDIKAKEVELIVSDNDKWISVDEAQEIAKNLNAQFTIIKNGGHINSDSGFGKWEYIENRIINNTNF